MKNQLTFKTVILGLTLLGTCACERDKPASNFDLLTNGSFKVWNLKRIEPNSSDVLVCLTDDQHKFISDGKYIVDNMGTFLTDDMGHLSCSNAPNLISTYAWSLNVTMDTITILYPNSFKLCKVQKLTTDSLILKCIVNGTWIQTEFYLAKK